MPGIDTTYGEERATILVADDDDDIRALLEGTLTRAGYDVVVARDGEQAIRLADRCLPDVAVLDLMMPQVDGYEITRHLRRHRALRGMAIILVTARTLDRDVALGFEAGADDYLKKPFGPMELRNRVDTALANVRRLSAAVSLALTDALTALPNRRALEDALMRMAAQSSRSGLPLAALMIDADHFKSVNDDFGHPVGDRVLVSIGEVLGSSLRASDVAGRWSGEEFLVLLPDTAPAAAAHVAEKLRKKIEAIAVPDLERSVTASVGVAVLPEHARDALELVSAADEALYGAKHKGRNQVEVATPRLRQVN